MRFAGITPAVTTPFDRTGAIDFEGLDRNVRFLLDAGVHGIVATGTMGEAGSLGADEREIEHHFRTIASAGGLPLMLYNNPEASGTDMAPDLIARLARGVDEIVAVKECSGDARRIAALLNETDDLDVLVGGDDWALEGFCASADGWVSGVADVAPRECIELWERCRAGELERAREIYWRLLPLSRFDMTPKLVQYFKAAMDETGLAGGHCRPPRLPLTDDERADLRQALSVLREESLTA